MTQFTDIYIRAEDEAHAVLVAQGAGVLPTHDESGNEITTIPDRRSTNWEPDEALITNLGITITPDIEDLLLLVPDGGWDVFYFSTATHTEETEGVSPQTIPGAWYGLRIFAPVPAVALLKERLSFETWEDGITPVLVTHKDFPTLARIQ